MKVSEFNDSLDSRLLNILTENIQYENMLKTLEPIADHLNQQIPYDIINKLKRTLKKNDRIVWYLKWYRLSIFRKWINLYALNHRDNNPPELVDYVQKLKAKWGYNLNELDIFERHFLLNNNSWLSLFIPKFKIPTIDAVVWDINKTPTDLRLSLYDASQKWQDRPSLKNKQRWIDHDLKPPAEEILSFRGGTWFNLGNDLDQSGEGEAMEHGHFYSDDDDVILSYRKPGPGKDNKWRPHLSFQWNEKTGLLSHMVGYNGMKPERKYHPAIIQLLMHDMVRGFLPGYGDDDAGFSMSDINPKKFRDALKKHKPELMTLTEYYKFKGRTIPELIRRINEAYEYKTGEYAILFDKKANGFLLGHEKNLNDSVIEFGNDETKNLMANLKEGHLDWEFGYNGVEQDTLHQYWSEEKTDKVMTEYFALYNKNYKNLNHRDIDLNDYPELEQSLYFAYSEGQEVGTINEMWNALKIAIENWEYDVILENKDGYWDSPRKVIVSIDLMIEKLNDEYFESLLDSKIEINTPYNGWSDYDYDAAMERFIETLDDGISSLKSKPKS